MPHINDDGLNKRILSHTAALSPSAYRVAKFINENRAIALASSAAELAKAVGTSDATVVRTVQSLGFGGLAELRQELADSLDQQPSTPAGDMRRTLSDVGEDADRAIDLVFDTHVEAVEELRRPEARAKLTDAVAALHRAARIVVFGVGPSAPLAHYAAILLARDGRRARALDATGVALADQLLDLQRDDALLIIAYGRSYQEVAAVFAEARRLRLQTVLITDSLDHKLSRRADVVVPAKRGRAARVALHGATMVTLEALILGLAASDQKRALETLDRLNELRETVNGRRIDVG